MSDIDNLVKELMDEGISEEVARETVEFQFNQENKEEPKEEKQEEKQGQTEEAKEEHSPDPIGTPTPEQKSSKEEGEKTVPLAALQEERKKRQEKDSELQQLRNELEQLRKQSQQQFNIEPKDEKQEDNEEEKQSQPTASYRRQLIQKAKEVFESEHGRKPDIYNDEDDAAEITLIANDIHTSVVAEANKIQSEKQRIKNTFDEFAKIETAKPDYQEIWNFVVDRVNGLPPDMQKAYVDAFEKAKSGTGTMQDVLTVKALWESSELLWRNNNKPTEQQNKDESVIPVEQKQKTAEQKLSEIEKHPRSNQLSGSNGAKARPTVAELARMVQDTEWDAIPDEYKKLLMEG